MVKTVRDLGLKGSRILMRVDFNVPMKDGEVQDDERIVAAIPTINYLFEQGVQSLTIMSHLGDPEKDAKKAEEKAKKQSLPFDKEVYINAKHKMKNVASYLSKKLGKDVIFIEDLKKGYQTFLDAPPSSILMLENTRFDKREKFKEVSEREELAKEFSRYGTIFVNDAFGSAHREHASTCTVAKFAQHAVAGLLMEKEIKNLDAILKNPKQPLTAIIGGAKVSSKISVLRSLLEKVQTLIIGGGMAYTFLKSLGHSIGGSILEEDYIDEASSLIKTAKERGVKIILPLDHVCAENFQENAKPIAIDSVDIPESLIAMDIGKKTIEEYKKAISTSSSIIWNGPVGVFEFVAFERGTKEIAQAVASATEKGRISVVGGGDSVASVKKFNLKEKMTHVSTGGGASLEYMEGKTLPGIACLETV